jgi:hypothetical protein
VPHHRASQRLGFDVAVVESQKHFPARDFPLYVAPGGIHELHVVATHMQQNSCPCRGVERCEWVKESP